jgi:radical SAM-linked protein
MQRLTITFRKAGSARHLSHLDLMATLEFAVRRARLPVALAEGFNPRPRMSLAAPLPLGHIGERELLEITLKEERAPDEVRAGLANRVAAGIEILSVEEAPGGTRSAASRVYSVEYRVRLADPVDDLAERIAALMARPTIDTEEEHDGSLRRRDLRLFILKLHAGGERELAATIRLGGDGTVRPEQILDLLSIATDGAQFIRERIHLTEGSTLGPTTAQIRPVSD